MRNLLQLLKIIAAIERRGLDFTKEKMLCPLCHSELKVYKTFDWDGETRIRYHKCPACGRSFKSIETRNVQEEVQPIVVPSKNVEKKIDESVIKKPVQKKQHKSKRKNKNKESEKQNKKRRKDVNKTFVS